jgi:hypothetical protein
MAQIQFIPGRLVAPYGPLARYRPIQPVQAASAYVQSLTQTGDVVVDLFCQGPTVMREAVAMGRRALGFSANPLLLMAARLGLSQRDTDALNSAFTRLVDSPKGDQPLRRYLTSLYESACPACGVSGTAVWFAWDRDGNYPFKKAVYCPECEDVEEGPPDSQDIASAHRVHSRGLAYYYALDRVAPPGHPSRERAAELVGLYTPRNLSALMDLSMRLEGLEAIEAAKLALASVLLDCFDAGSSLDPYDEERPRPRTLRVPSRYIERNVWLCFEESFSRLLASESPLPVQQAPDVAALLRGDAEGYALVSHAARDVQKTVPAESVALIFTDPPRPDGVFWALSALWAGWLWESDATHALRPFLRRRRFDWEWHHRVLQTSLKAAGPLLTPEGHLVVLFSDPDTALIESVCLAASGAGFALEAWGYCPEVGHRLIWRWHGMEPAPPADAETLKRDLAAVAETTALTTLQERGEPTGWPLLHSSGYVELSRQGLLARTMALLKDEEDARTFTFVTDTVRRAFEAIPMLQLADPDGAGETLWWLVEPSRVAEPLADRVGALVQELLVQQQLWDLEDLVNTIYTHFAGPLTPELALVLVCIDSYTMQEGTRIRLRPEDDPRRRAVEVKALRDDLIRLGRRLGFVVKRRKGWDVRWLGEKGEAYVFDVSATLALGRHLLTKRTADEGARRCLVVPGGRAALVSFQLQRDPRLARAVELDGWQFIKFRHLRRLVTKEDLDRHALKTVLGLDPIADQEAAQIPLF